MLDRKGSGARMAREQSTGDTVPILKPKDPKEADKRTSSVVLPNYLWDELQAIADAADYSRNEVIEEFLKWGIEQHRKETSDSGRRMTKK
jgi:hypothetical protein